MLNIGCTIIHKERGLASDLAISWDFQKKRGSWAKLTTPVSKEARNGTPFTISERGDVIQSVDMWNGQEKYALSIYEAGTKDRIDATGSAGSLAFFHLLCGDAKSVYDRVSCGKFLSGEAIIWRPREYGDYEFWMGCS